MLRAIATRPAPPRPAVSCRERTIGRIPNPDLPALTGNGPAQRSGSARSVFPPYRSLPPHTHPVLKVPDVGRGIGMRREWAAGLLAGVLALAALGSLVSPARAQTAVASGPARHRTIGFVDAEIAAVADEVLGRQLRSKIIVSPHVRGECHSNSSGCYIQFAPNRHRAKSSTDGQPANSSIDCGLGLIL